MKKEYRFTSMRSPSAFVLAGRPRLCIHQCISARRLSGWWHSDGRRTDAHEHISRFSLEKKSGLAHSPGMRPCIWKGQASQYEYATIQLSLTLAD